MDFKAMFNNLKDETKNFTKQEIENGKVMGILSYLSILCLIPYFLEKDNKYVRFHAIQGINIFLFSIIYAFASTLISIVLFFIPIIGYILFILINLLPLGFTVLSIMGIIYTCQDKALELPIINVLKLIKK